MGMVQRCGKTVWRLVAGLAKTGWLLFPAAAIASLPGPARTARASASDGGGDLCTISMQMDNPDLCPSDGAAPQRADYWELGLLPRGSPPALPLDPALGQLDRGYGRAGGSVTLGFYRSVDDAVAGKAHHTIYKGYVYVSIIQTLERNGSYFYRTGTGWIVRGDEVTPYYLTNQFTGVTLAEPPSRPFGWVIPYEGVYPSRTPGGPADNTATYYPRYGLVEIFDRAATEQGDWYLIGINQWIEQKKVGVVFPDLQRPADIPAGEKWIRINLFEQTLAAFEGDRMVFATLTATGTPGFWTRPGVYPIYKKYEMQTMSGAFEQDHADYYYLEDVPWVMYFDGDRAIHGEYWHNNLGARHSHGCVNIPVADGHWMYDWAPEGTWVYVFDPSGKTPTDHSAYGKTATA
jgi:hypothetical protein